MNTVAIDSKALNSLFDNQKRLDDLFDSIFDDQNYLISASVYSAPAQKSYVNRSSDNTDHRMTNFKQSRLAVNQNRFAYLIPILLEIAIIYWVVTNCI